MKDKNRAIVKWDQPGNPIFYYCCQLFFVFALLMAGSKGAPAKEITLSWAQNQDAVDGYKLFSRFPEETYDYKNPFMTISAAQCNSGGCFVSVKVPDNSEVYFVVRAYLGNGVESLDSNETLYRGIKSSLPSEISLSWTPNKDVVEGYRIYRRTSDGKYNYSSPVATVPASGCSPDRCATLLTLDEYQDYYFVVRAYSGSNVESQNSNEVFFDAETFAQEIADLSSKEEAKSSMMIDAVSGMAESLSKNTQTITGANISPSVEKTTTEDRDLHPAVEVFNNQYEHQKWIEIMWNEYMAANGESRVAMGDIDGDGKDEIIIGLGPDNDPAIPGGMFQVLNDDYTPLAWGQIKWDDYNSLNGESFPACGDIDGDGIDEIFMGLGEGGQGKVEVFNYRSGVLHHKDWVQVDWPDYNQHLGKTRPTCGDIDQDGKDEVIIGLGSNQSDPEMPAGLFQILDDDYSSLAWGEVDWPDYNRLNGETYPSCANLSGEGDNRIVVGLGSNGEGRMEVFQFKDGAASHKDWITIDWDVYNKTVGETRPVSGDVDGDGKDEIIVGLASNQDDPQIPGGVFPILDSDYTHLAWSEIEWDEYNKGNGESLPATGDTNADHTDEIMIGLGVRSAFAESGTTGETPSTVSSAEGDGGKGGCFITSVANLL